MQHIIKDMEMTRLICSMILQARQKNGFVSVKYPITDVIISHVVDPIERRVKHLMPEYRELIAEECNIVGYMDIPAVSFSTEKPTDGYAIVESGDIWVAVSLVKSKWQEELYNQRMEKRNDSLSKKLSMV